MLARRFRRRPAAPVPLAGGETVGLVVTRPDDEE